MQNKPKKQTQEERRLLGLLLVITPLARSALNCIGPFVDEKSIIHGMRLSAVEEAEKTVKPLTHEDFR